MSIQDIFTQLSTEKKNRELTSQQVALQMGNKFKQKKYEIFQRV